MHTTTISGPAGKLHLVDTGEPGEGGHRTAPVLLIHGMVGHVGFWDGVLPHLRSGRRVLALDLRGHGASEPPQDGDYSPAACAGDVLAVLDALALPRVALVGHSYGTLVALAAAATAPERAERVILADPPGDLNHLPTAVRDEYLTALAGDRYQASVEATFTEALEGGAPSTRDIVLGRLAATPRDRLLGMSESLFAFDAIDAIDRYQAHPGARVAAVLAPANAWPYSVHVLRPAIAATVVPDTGHWLLLDAPDRFGAALSAALDAA